MLIHGVDKVYSLVLFVGNVVVKVVESEGYLWILVVQSKIRGWHGNGFILNCIIWRRGSKLEFGIDDGD